MADWNSFDKFEDVIDKYMQPRGEGDTKASQVVTAVNKLIYKAYNDGDVFDNTYNLEGWANDLSSYANWLHNKVPRSRRILAGIRECYTDDDYTDLLYDLAIKLLDEDFLAGISGEEKVGTIYDCDGPYKYEERWG